MQANMHEAKTHLSRLIGRVEAGEEVVIAKAGKPVARLVPFVEQRERRVPGALRGRISMAPDFDDIDEDLVELFHDSPVLPGE